MKVMFRFCLAFTFIFSILILRAESVTEVEQLLNSASSDSAKIAVLNSYSEKSRSQSADLAKNYALKALELAEKSGLKQAQANALLNIGLAYVVMGEYVNALDFCLRALKINEDLGNKLSASTVINTIGTIYYKKEDYLKALDYYKMALKIREELGDKKLIAASINNLGLIYYNQNNFNKAREHFERSLAIQREINDSYSEATTLQNIGLIYSDELNYSKAITTMLESYELFSELKNIEGMAGACNNLGDFYFAINNYPLAIKYQLKTVDLTTKTGNNEVLKEAYGGLSKIYAKQGDYKSAFKYKELYSQIKDTLFDIQKNKSLVEMQTKFETEKKEKENELLRQTNEVKELEISKNQADLSRQRTILYSALAVLLLVSVSIVFVYRSYKEKQRANEALKEAYDQIEEKNYIVEQKNKDITDSIRYAKRIQEAILPPQDKLKGFVAEHFILFKPKDIVSGDFYWIERWGNSALVAAVDCTGHGVPGAFMSIVGHNLLNQTVNEHGIAKPSLVLNSVNKGLSKILHQSPDSSGVKDGMDIALCSITPVKDNADVVAKLEYAGAYNPLWIFRNGNLIEVKADKFPVGSFVGSSQQLFSNNEFDLQKGDTCYVFSDGYTDQFGGPFGKKFKHAAFKNLLKSIQHKPLEEQGDILNAELEGWKGSLEQVDDVLVIGFRV